MLRTGVVARLAAAPLLLLLVGTAESAHAGDRHDAPINLRFALALDRESSRFTDVVGLSASTAYPYGSPANPANDDFLRQPPNDFRLAVTGTGFYIPFDRGALITAGATSVSYRLPDAGTLTASYSAIGSHDAATRQGDKFRLDSHGVTIGYSHLLSVADIPLAIGGEFAVVNSTQHFESSVLGFPLNTQSDTTEYVARFGALTAPARHWLVGLMGGAGWAYTDTDGEVAIPASFGGPQPVRFHTFTRSVNLRAGVGWRPSDKFGTRRT